MMMLACGSSACGTSNGANGMRLAAINGPWRGGAGRANSRFARSQLWRQPRVRRLARPRRNRLRPRTSHSRRSANAKVMRLQLQLTAQWRPSAATCRGGLDSASRPLSHSAAEWRRRSGCMARIEYDEDEQGDTRATAGDWRRRLVTWTLAAIGLGIGFLVPYTFYLNHQISERFGELRWQVPTRVYARPLRLAPGLAMDAQTLKTELDAASYREGDGVRAGTYLRDGGRWTIASRGFRDVDGEVGPSRIEAT